jgi:hypothetical protein
MKTLFSLSLNLTLSLLLITVFSLSFINLGEVRPKGIKKQPKERYKFINSISQSFLISLVLISLISYNFPKFGINPKTPLMIFGYALTIFCLARVVYLHERFHYFQIIACSAIAGSWNVIPGLVILAQNGVSLGMVSIFNNDISNYAGLATEVLDNGFLNNSHYFEYDLNKFSELYSYQTPVGLVEFLSSVTKLDPWQIMMPVLICATAYFSISIFRLVENLFPNLERKRIIFIAFIIPVLPIFGYITNNYFLGQLIGSAIILQIVSVNFEIWKKGEIDKGTTIELTGLFILSIFAYPHVLIPIYAIALFSNFVFHVKKRVRIRKFFWHFTFIVVFTCGISFSYIQQSLFMLRNTSNASAGWPLPIFNPLTIFISPSTINVNLGAFATICSWTIFIFGAMYLLRFSKSEKFKYEKNFIRYLVCISVIFWLAILIIRGRDLTEYSSWKLFTYVLPIFLCVFIPYVISNSKVGVSLSFVLLGLALTFPFSIWEPYYKNQLFTSASFVQAVESPEISKLQALNIDLGHFFESMNAAMIIRNPQIHLAGPTYYNKSFNPNACTLVWLTNKNYGEIIPLNESYGLGLGTNKECR